MYTPDDRYDNTCIRVHTHTHRKSLYVLSVIIPLCVHSWPILNLASRVYLFLFHFYPIQRRSCDSDDTRQWNQQTRSNMQATGPDHKRSNENSISPVISSSEPSRHTDKPRYNFANRSIAYDDIMVTKQEKKTRWNGQSLTIDRFNQQTNWPVSFGQRKPNCF